MNYPVGSDIITKVFKKETRAGESERDGLDNRNKTQWQGQILLRWSRGVSAGVGERQGLGTLDPLAASDWHTALPMPEF